MKKVVSLSLLVLLIFSANMQSAQAGEGHDAGYRWAEEHDIQDTGYSNGNSESFNEGVRQYAEEQQQDESES